MSPDWPTCGKVQGTGKPKCRGARVAGEAQCWAHLQRDQFEGALDHLESDRELDLRGTEVTPKLLGELVDRLRQTDKKGRMQFSELRCQQTVFTGPVVFDKMIFARNTSFSSARFAGGVAFSDVTFGEDFDFSAFILGNAVFADIEFGGIARFAGIECRQLRLCEITGTAVDFTGACVTDEFIMDPARISGTLTLSGLRADGPVDIRAEVKDVVCHNAEFAGRTRFRLTRAAMCLADTTFAEPASVESAGGLVQLYSLQGVDAEHLTLVNVDFSLCLLSGLLRPEQLRLEGRCVFASTPRKWTWRFHCLPWRWTARDTIYEENLWWVQHQDSPFGWSAERPAVCSYEKAASVAPDAARLAVLYRQLRRAVEDARNEPGAADLYYGEMEMRRLSTGRWDERLLLTAYWLVSGYGLRATRALLALAGLLLVTAAVLQQTGFAGPSHGYADYLLYASGASLSLDLASDLPKTLTEWGEVIRMILRVGGPVLLGLAALALRGRIKR